MSNWIYFAAATAILLAAADFFVKIASGRLSNSLAMALYGCTTFIFGMGWVLWQRAHHVTLHAQPLGILAAIIVGITFSLVTLGLYVTFGAGAPISVASPLIRLTGLVLASIIGLTFLREPLTARYVLGVILACLGIYLIISR